MKAIIVDDEARARRSLEVLLQTNHPEIIIAEQCFNVPQAVLAIRQHKPDVVFLDIEMPEFNGFELMNFFDSVDFEIVFVTAYSEYAMQAFEISAVDYLLKPVQVNKLKAAIEKVKEQLHTHNMKQRLEVLQQNLQDNEFSRIALPVRDGLLFIEVNEIIMLEADGAYTRVFLANGSNLYVSKKLKFFEELLAKRKTFFRIHRSHLINLNFVKKYNRIETFIEMDNGVSMPVSKERKKEFEESLSQIRIGR
jgi:two-component system LytT family response regulator